MRRRPKATEVLPVPYLRGLSTNDFAPAPGGSSGPPPTVGIHRAAVDRGVPSTPARITVVCRTSTTLHMADGVYGNVRLPDVDGEDRLCLPVIVGVRSVRPRRAHQGPDEYRYSVIIIGIPMGSRAEAPDAALGATNAGCTPPTTTSTSRVGPPNSAHRLDSITDGRKPRVSGPTGGSPMCESTTHVVAVWCGSRRQTPTLTAMVNDEWKCSCPEAANRRSDDRVCELVRAWPRVEHYPSDEPVAQLILEP